MRMRACPMCPLVGPGPGGLPEGGRVAASVGSLQGIPKGRKVIREPAPPTAAAGDGDGQGAEGNNRPASAVVRRRERRRLSA